MGRKRRLCDEPCRHAYSDHATRGLRCLAVVNDPDQSALIPCACQRYVEGPPRVILSLKERFWSKVAKGEGCWEWQGSRFRRTTGRLSYGMFLYRGKLVPAHRVGWVLTFGLIPEGKLVLHHCDNQGCVRPDHLYLGTHADNTRDAVERMRMTRGTERWNHKLTEELVRAIRARVAEGIPTERIGEEFGVSGRTVRYIRNGERWAHV